MDRSAVFMTLAAHSWIMQLAGVSPPFFVLERCFPKATSRKALEFVCFARCFATAVNAQAFGRAAEPLSLRPSKEHLGRLEEERQPEPWPRELQGVTGLIVQ